MEQLVHQFRTIVADPPWDVKAGPAHFADNPNRAQTGADSRSLEYPTMSLDDIKALPVERFADVAGADAHLYLWTINSYLRDAFDVAQAWGFTPVTTIAWCKTLLGGGLGGVWPTNTEFVLFCRKPKQSAETLRLSSYLADAAEARGLSRGDIDRHMGTSDMAGWWLSRLPHRTRCPTNDQWQTLKVLLRLGDEMDSHVHGINAAKGRTEIVRAPSSWFQWPRGKHSEKPEAFFDVVEQVSPGPYLELFARRRRLGWSAWGNEVDSDVEMAA